MKIQIDVTQLIKNKLSFQQYFVLYSLCHKEFDLLYEYLANGHNDYDQAIMLEVNGYIESLILTDQNVIDYQNIIPTNKAFEFLGFSKKDLWFDDIWRLFPRETPSGRILKQISKDKAKKKYTTLIKSAEEHTSVKKALERELMHRHIHNNMNYMQSLQTWLNNESWNAFKEDIIGEDVHKPYGSSIE